MKPLHIQIALVVGIVALAGVYFYFFPLSFVGSPTATTTEAHVIDVDGIGHTISNPGYTIEPVPQGSTLAYPPLGKAVAYDQLMPQADRDASAGRITKLRDALGKNPNDANSWFSLAIEYASVGDQLAAIEVWQFLMKVVSSPVPAENIGKSYLYHLNDFGKAEEYLTIAKVASTTLFSPYNQLHILYRYSTHDDTKAVQILKEAASHVSEPLDAWVTLAQYYRDTARPADARVYYEKAIDRARAVGNMPALSQLTKELDALPK